MISGAPNAKAKAARKPQKAGAAVKPDRDAGPAGPSKSDKMPKPAKSPKAAKTPKPAKTPKLAKAARPRVAVLVLGMHRSGTSALARVLSLLGCALPNTLLGGNPTNPAGHWESDAIVAFDDDVLASAGSSWSDLWPLNPGWFGSLGYEQFVERGVEVLAHEYGAAPLLVVKDPRMCRIVPLWLDILAAADIAPAMVLPVRNPLEVADSLHRRDGMDPSMALLFWLRHVLDAEMASRGRRRVFTRYDHLLAGWGATVARIERGLGLTWPRSSVAVQQEIEGFLDHELRHNRHADRDVIADPLLSGWIRETYAVMLRWSDEGEVEAAAEYATLDRIRAAFDEAAPAFARPLVRLEQQRWQLADATRQRDEAAEQLASLQAEHEAAVARTAGLETHFAAVEMQWGQKSRRIEELEAEAAQMAQLHADLGQQVAMLQDQVDEAVGALAAARAEAQDNAHRLAEKASEAAQRHEEAQQAWDLAQAHEAKAAELAGLLAKSAAEAERQQDEADDLLANLAARRHEAEDESRRLALRLDAEARRRESAEALVERLREELDRKAGLGQAEVEALRAELARAETRAAELAARAPAPVADPALAETLRTRTDELAQARLTESQLRAELHTSRLAAESALARLAGAEAEAAEAAQLRQRLAEAGAERDAVRARLAAAEAQASERATELARTGRNLNRAEADLRAQNDLLGWLREVDRVVSASTKWYLGWLPHGWRRRMALRKLQARGLFDAWDYAARYPDVSRSGMDPLRHYILHGLEEGRSRC